MMKKGMKGIVFTVLVTLFFGMQSCGSKSIDTAVLENNHWVLTSMNGVDAKTLFEGPIPTIDFNFTDSIVYGSSGCNRYTGGFSLEKGMLRAPHMASTRMACPFENAETEFLMAFAAEEGVKVCLEKEDVLKLENGETSLVFAKGEKTEEE